MLISEPHFDSRSTATLHQFVSFISSSIFVQERVIEVGVLQERVGLIVKVHAHGHYLYPARNLG